MVVTPKSNGKVRVCVDLSKLNEYVKRENHPLPAVDTALRRLAGSRVFSKFDVNLGFWQIKLAGESRPLTTATIADLLGPQNMQELRTFLGMVNQLSKFSEHLADEINSIRDLLHKGNQWTRGSDQQKAF